MSKFVVLGGVTYDTIVQMHELPEQKPATLYCRGYHETVGSTGAGKALALHKLGASVKLFGALGKDAWGEKIVRYLQEQGVDFHYDIDPMGTERHVNLMDQEGGRVSIFLSVTSSDMPIEMEEAAAAIEASDVVALNIIGYCKRYIPLLEGCGKPVWCDLHDYDGKNPYYKEFIEAADYLFLSSDKLPDYRPLMERWVAEGKKLVVCTHGKHGATALTGAGEWIEVPIVSAYQRVDTNGAGDNFFSGFVHAQALGYDVPTSLRVASIVAGLCITSKELVSEQLSWAKVCEDYEANYGESL